MINNIWSGNKVSLRAILPTDWERFHNNDFDSESARLCDVIHFPRSEEGTKQWAGNQASKGPDGDNFSLAIETRLRFKTWNIQVWRSNFSRALA
jgi:hypothetical protein